MKLSQHSKIRMRQRTELNHKARRHFFREALDKGKSLAEIQNEDLKKYIMSKQNCKVKIYKDYIFLYSKNTKRLYTMYKLPEKYRENE